MGRVSRLGERRTSVDDVFSRLHDDIVCLRLRPGDKLSEADVAARFGVSRQPVRDAFSRLANLDLLVIRPQRATEVRRFSMREIKKSRFVRAAVETEVLRRAAQHCDSEGDARLDAATAEQAAALNSGDVDGFGALDLAFHEVLSSVARAEFAHDVIRQEKAKIDRLCLLGMSKEIRMPELLADHRAIAAAVKAHDPEAAVACGMRHLSRLDETIARISVSNADYFESHDDG